MCSGALQLLQISIPDAPARSQWPRAAHSGLMHCTVQPGKYCTFSPFYSGMLQAEPAPVFQSGSPVCCEPEIHREKLREFCASCLVASREKIQYLVVRLQNETGKTICPRRRTDQRFPVPLILGKKAFALYNLSLLAHNLCFRYADDGQTPGRFIRKFQSV